MKKSKSEFASVNEFAALMGVDSTTITKAIQKGRITAYEKSASNYYKIDIKKATEEYTVHRDRLRQKQELQQKRENELSLKRQTKDDQLARLAQIKVWQLEGRLIEVERVDKMIFEALRAIRNAITNLPDRLAPVLSAENDIDKCHAILNKEVFEILTEAANEIERTREEFVSFKSFVDESPEARADEESD